MTLAPEIVDSPVLGVDEILNEHEYRQKRFQDRDVWYEKLLSYYFGRNQGEGTLPILFANSQGRPLLRPVGESINSRRTYSSQRLAPIVDDYSALMGRMPTTRVELPDPGQQGEQKAALLTKFLYSTYEMSRMEYQQAYGGFLLSCMGDAVYLLEPDPDTLRVVWNVQSPRNCWPSFYHGWRRFEVFDMIVNEVWSPSDLRRQWGVQVENDRTEHCAVVTYLSPYQRTVIVGLKNPRRVAHVEWDLGFCPAVWTFNRVTGIMGMSDIANSLGQQDFLDFALNVWADGIVHMTYPMLGIKNPMNMGQDNITIGPGAPPVVLQGDGDIIVRNTQGNPQSLVEIIAQTLQDINAASGTSDVRQQGAMKSSVVYGRAVQSVQGPQSTRIEFKQQVLGAAIEAANRMTLAMQEKAPYLKNFQGDIYGSVRGAPFIEKFDASKDIAGWHRTRVTWEALVGMNMQQKAQVAAEMMQFKLIDDLQAREYVGVEDPLAMRKRIEAQLQAEAELQGQMQGALPPGGGTQGGALPPKRGMMPAMRPPGLRPQQAQPGGGPMSINPPAAPGKQTNDTDTLAPLKAALGKVAGSLKGEVWLVNDTTVLITDHRDYTRVKQAIAKELPNAKVRQADAENIPESATRLV